MQKGGYDDERTLIPITIELVKMVGENAFALKMENESMEP